VSARRAAERRAADARTRLDWALIYTLMARQDEPDLEEALLVERARHDDTIPLGRLLREWEVSDRKYRAHDHEAFEGWPELSPVSGEMEAR